MTILQMPNPASDTYKDAAELGKLQREIGETMVEQAGADGARKALNAARQGDDAPTGPASA